MSLPVNLQRPDEVHGRRALGFLLLAALFCLAWASWPAAAQDEGPLPPDQARRLADEALAQSPDTNPPAPQPASLNVALPELNMLDLLIRGGSLMIPIGVMSLIVVVFAVERFLGLRRNRIVPAALISALGEASSAEGGLDPRKVYRICQKFPSTASTVLRAAMLKVGRPHAEVEHTVKEACEREAAKLYSNVRPLNLATVVTPLIGLLGTVWGMIMCFFKMASGQVHTNKAEQLADGIYTALVTTLGGLAVAIPAAMLAHWFEGRIQAHFREIDELLLNMLPQLERFEGKLRVHRRTGKDEAAAEHAKEASDSDPKLASQVAGAKERHS
jgi:biopolymer transport protein ExbB